MPSILSQSTKPSLFSRSLFTIDKYKTLLISEDFPEPETPVTHVNKPIGILTLISFRLLAEAFVTDIHFLFGLRRLFGTSILFLPEIKSYV